MDILILGGTAFLGPAIVEAATKKGHKITLFNRGKTRSELFPDLEKLHGDRDKNEYDALKGRTWDAAIDTSAQKPIWIRQTAEALGKSVKHYMFTSSISVYPMNSFQKPGKDETAPVEQWPPDAKEDEFKMELYGNSKARCESIAMEAWKDHCTVVRPGLIVGPGDYSDRFTYWPVRVAEGGEILAPGDPEAPVQFIDARDLGAFQVKLIEDSHAGIYNATGPRLPLAMAGLLYGCAAAVSNDAHFTWVPDKFCLEHELGAWMEMPLWIPDDPDSRGFSQVSIEKAVSHGLTFRPLADIARDTLEWSKKRKVVAGRKPRAGLSREKEKQILAAWHAEKKDGGGATTQPATKPS